MLRIRDSIRGQRGFTLVEVLISLTIFLIVTLGAMPLFVSALRGSAVSRSYTVGKNIVVEAGERVRGLPYFVAFPTQMSYTENVPPFRKVDVLDLYFPDLATGSSTGYEASVDGADTNDTYVTVCNASNDPNPACPRTLPAGYSITYMARFVLPEEDSAGSEQYARVDPAEYYGGDYRWDSVETHDEAPSQFLEMTIRGEWTYQGRDRSFETVTIVGEREYGKVVVRGTARVDYAVQIGTGFVDSSGVETVLVANGGSSDAFVETKTASTASQNVRAAEIKLSNPDPALEDPIIDQISGASEGIGAAPDSAPLDTSVVGGSVTHPELGSVAGFGDTSTRSLYARVSGELPTSGGGFLHSGSPLWVLGQTSSDPNEDLHLVPAGGLVKVTSAAGETTTITTPKSAANRSVTTTSSVQIPRIEILPIDLLGAELEDETTTSDRAVLIIQDFSASVDCLSTPSTGGTSTYEWDAKVRYLLDKDPNDGIRKGKYSSPIPVSSSLTGDPFASIPNEVVYEGADPSTNDDDVFLFDDPANDKRGYLTNLSAAYEGTAGLDSGLDPETGKRFASIDSAIRVSTASTHPGIAASAIQVDVGKLSCDALDAR